MQQAGWVERNDKDGGNSRCTPEQDTQSLSPMLSLVPVALRGL